MLPVVAGRHRTVPEPRCGTTPLRRRRNHPCLDDLRRDVLYAARTLRRTPGFTSVVVLTLALGIAAVTIIYSVVRNVLLDPFPYADSDRLVNVIVRDASGKTVGSLFGSEEFLAYAEQTTVFEDVVGTKLQVAVYGTTDVGAARLNIAWMTPKGFAFLGVLPLLEFYGSTAAGRRATARLVPQQSRVSSARSTED